MCVLNIIKHNSQCYSVIHFFIFVSSIKQLSESEESEDEAQTKATLDKKAAHSSGKKYVPPKIAPVHYGKANPFIAFCFFACHRKNCIFLMEWIFLRGLKRVSFLSLVDYLC